jgi:hypothetical protein
MVSFPAILYPNSWVLGCRETRTPHSFGTGARRSQDDAIAYGMTPNHPAIILNEF